MAIAVGLPGAGGALFLFLQGGALFFVFVGAGAANAGELFYFFIAYRLSLIAYRLSLIAYRLSLIAYRLSPIRVSPHHARILQPVIPAKAGIQ
ncbi:hypothetical protein [Lysobacter capsici]|uniref:hypothetical protein n=1 Tax=Lysobacter capsici TaxID=435897 RepID=UPI001C007963|nr:hypothetical protein [Lysobacter capsici]QWF17984.1 hypothetical protein KME82_04185 [Lysobacter capsici]